MDIRISEEEANKRLPELLLDVQSGTRYLITVDDEIVAVMSAASDDEQEREAARRHIMENPEL